MKYRLIEKKIVIRMNMVKILFLLILGAIVWPAAAYGLTPLGALGAAAATGAGLEVVAQGMTQVNSTAEWFMSENLDEKQITEVQRAIDHLKENGFKEEAAQAQKMLDNSKSRVWRVLGSTFVYDKTPPKEDLLAVTYGGPVNGILNNGHITLRGPFFDSDHDGPIENLTDEQKVRLRAKTLIHELEHLNSQANVLFRSRLADWIRDTEHGPREKHLSSLNQLGYTKGEIQKIKDKYNEDPVLVKHVPVIDKELLKPKPLPKDESEEAAKPPQKNLVSIAVSPKSAELAVGGSQHFSATAIYSDGTTNDVTGSAKWSGGDGNSFTARKGGTFSLSATYQGISGTASVNVKKTLTAVSIAPARKTIKINEAVSFTATAAFDDGSTENITGKATWSPDNTFIGTESGTFTVTVQYEGLSNTAAVTVKKSLKSISVTPSGKTIKIDESVSFAAAAVFDDGSAESITGKATWSPGNTFTATKAGTFMITATYGGLSAKATVIVNPKESGPGGYDPRSDPTRSRPGKPIDTAQADRLGDEFQRGTGRRPDTVKPSAPRDATPQPDTYTAKPQQEATCKTDADCASGQVCSGGKCVASPYPPYGLPPDDRRGEPGKDWTDWATRPPKPSKPQKQPPTTAQPQQPPADTLTVICSTTAKSGADAPATVTVKVGKSSGTAKFSYTMYTVKDRMIVQYGGKTLLDTGCVSGSKTIPLSLSGVSDEVTVIVQPACEKKGTKWDFRLECPK